MLQLLLLESYVGRRLLEKRRMDNPISWNERRCSAFSHSPSSLYWQQSRPRSLPIAEDRAKKRYQLQFILHNLLQVFISRRQPQKHLGGWRRQCFSRWLLVAHIMASSSFIFTSNHCWRWKESLSGYLWPELKSTNNEMSFPVFLSRFRHWKINSRMTDFT